MASVNKVILVGNLGQDPEVRQTQNQIAMTTFSIATTEVRMKPDGQKQELTEWHRVVVWGKVAENCGKFLKKGRSVFIEGRLQTRAWDDKTSGQKRYTTEIVANSVQFLGAPQGAQAASYGSPIGAPQDQASAHSYDAFPPAQPASSSHSFYAAPAPQASNDFDDLPF